MTNAHKLVTFSHWECNNCLKVYHSEQSANECCDANCTKDEVNG